MKLLWRQQDGHKDDCMTVWVEAELQWRMPLVLLDRYKEARKTSARKDADDMPNLEQQVGHEHEFGGQVSLAGGSSPVYLNFEGIAGSGRSMRVMFEGPPPTHDYQRG